MVLEKWTDDETNSFLAYWNDHMEEYSKQKMAFYQAAARCLGTKEWKSVKNRCEHLDRKYSKIKQKMSASGFGVRETDPPTLRATITKEFKWYYELDDLLGKSTHVTPLVVVDTCCIPSDYEPASNNQDDAASMTQPQANMEVSERQFEFEMVTCREEMLQRQRQFELTYQNAQAKYELDKMMLEAKLRKLGDTD
ncbi:hypothetical protein AC1031_018512 [Aphanomyces cochlioides]|nr:hypothetical protein AC1031_018512 [Aphanomyces cochlioides]